MKNYKCFVNVFCKCVDNIGKWYNFFIIFCKKHQFNYKKRQLIKTSGCLKCLNWFKVRSWLVHFYTSLGLITGFLALTAMLEGNSKLAFFWLGVALVIDATDGTLARKFKVSQWTPGFDGRTLDDITDYLNRCFSSGALSWSVGCGWQSCHWYCSPLCMGSASPMPKPVLGILPGFQTSGIL